MLKDYVYAVGGENRKTDLLQCWKNLSLNVIFVYRIYDFSVFMLAKETESEYVLVTNNFLLQACAICTRICT